MRLTLRLALITLLLLVSAALARAGSFNGVDLMMSTVMQEHQSSFSGLGGRVWLGSAGIVPQIEFSPFIEYWRISASVPRFDVSTTRKDATLGALARYDFPRKGWSPYVGAGFGVHFLSSELSAAQLGVPKASDSIIKGGLAAVAGASIPLTSTIQNFVDLEYHHMPGMSQLKFSWGIAWGPAAH